MSNSNILNPEEYLSKAYINPQRWASYALQTKIISDLILAGKILEIGVGNGIMADFLKKKYDLYTVDINSSLKPNFVASVEDLSSIYNHQFDLVACFEVLEHLPFENFKKSLQELAKVSSRYIVISLPYWGYTFGLKIKLPIIGEKTFKFKISGTKEHKFNGQHYWEIGKRGYRLSLIKNEFLKSGLKLKKSFWDLNDPYHYYFILEK